MRNGVWMKGLVMGIIMLFVVTSVIPNIITNVNAKSEDKSLNISQCMEKQPISYSTTGQNLSMLQPGDIAFKHPDIFGDNFSHFFYLHIFNTYIFRYSTMV